MDPWPELSYAEWQPTKDTLHMYAQVLGKLRLALSPPEPHWGHVPLYVTARGLTTSPIPFGTRAFDAELDLIDHLLTVCTSDGMVERIALGPVPVAQFYTQVMSILHRLGIDVSISVLPSEVPHPIPFPDDVAPRTYDPGQVRRFFSVLSRVDLVLKQHRAAFRGDTSPVQFFWGTFDLAVTRFSGRRVAPPVGAGVIARGADDAEMICAGFWTGQGDVGQDTVAGQYPHPGFYAYAFPQPEDYHEAPVSPLTAGWSTQLGEFVLPYDEIRTAERPDQEILDFLRSTYQAGATSMGWSPDLT
jgi:hypothetical protein